MPHVSLLIRTRPWIPALLVGAVPLAVLPGAAAPFHTGKWTLVLTLVPLGLAVAALTGRLRCPLARWFVVWISVAAVTSLLGVAPWMSLFGSPNRNAGLLGVLVGVGAFVLGATTGDDTRAQRLVLRAAFISGGIVGLLGITEWAGLDLFGIGDLDVASRARSSWGSATFAASHIVLVLPMAVAHLRSRDSRWRVVGFICTATMTTGLLLTGTRGAWLGVAIAVVVMLPAWRRSAPVAPTSDDRSHPPDQPRRGPRRWLIGAAILVVVLGAVAPVLSSLGRSSAAGRVDLWLTSVAVIAERPITGAGLDTQRVVLPSGITPSFEAEHGSTELHDRAHNLVLDTLLTTGIVGLAALTALLFFLQHNIRAGIARVREHSPALVTTAVTAGLVAYLVTLLFAFSDPTIDPIAWLLLGLLVAALGVTSPESEGPYPNTDTPLAGEVTRSTLEHDVGARTRLSRNLTAALLAVCSLAGLVWGGREILAEYSLSDALDQQSTEHTAIALESLQQGARLAPARFDLDQIAARIITNSLNDNALAPVPGSDTRLSGNAEAMRSEMIAYGLERLDRARSVAGDDTDVMMDRAELLTSADGSDNALGLYRRILDLYPHSFRAHLGRGLAAINSGDVELAESSWYVATGLGPRDPRAWTNLGVLYEQQGAGNSAMDAFERALQIDPDNAAARTGLDRLSNPTGD